MVVKTIVFPFFRKEDLFDIGVLVTAAVTNTSVPLAPQSDVHIHK